MKELEFIDWVRGQATFPPEIVSVGPGDDCAAVRLHTQPLLATTDQCADGVHFRLGDCGCERAGYKAMARSLSDIAAMAGEAIAAVATVMAPRGLDRSDAEALYHGLRAAADPFDCLIVGGDFGAWDGPLLLTTTVFGAPTTGSPVLRKGALAGDALLVTGQLGGSIASGKHLRFVPRIREATALAGAGGVRAMIDISDGLGADLRHLCAAGGVGARVYADALPLSDHAARADDPVAAALTDGEDYELLLAVAAEKVEQLLAEPPIETPLTRIGEIVAGDRLEWVDASGRQRDWPGGYEHRS